ncbi:MAG: hypothetical protein M9928_07730 [Anaerolineae bacterium]|nr:hypothetical protein [Anaerolineae bacterium]
MVQLANHYRAARTRFPEEKLLVSFDIDGTIIDLRHMVVYVLQAYDRHYQTNWFHALQPEDIDFHENQVSLLLKTLDVPLDERSRILTWYFDTRWSKEAIIESHRPFRGVLELIRWLQLQPNTFVGLNTGRPESLRFDTLQSLNQLGQEYRVQFTTSLLKMNPYGWEYVPRSKAVATKAFRDEGYRIVAAIDNEPQSLQAIASADVDSEILLLHADTLFETHRSALPAHTVVGRSYDVSAFVQKRSLPQHVQFVWQRVDSRAKLERFMQADIHWAEVPIYRDPYTQQLAVNVGESDLTLDAVLAAFNSAERGINLKLHDTGLYIDQILELCDKHAIADNNLWFSGDIGMLKERDFRVLATRWLGAIIQVNIDPLASLIWSAPQHAKLLLEAFVSWGVTRFSLGWHVEHRKNVLKQFEHWNFDINIHNVDTMEAFLRAALLLPTSITSDFSVNGISAENEHDAASIIPLTFA